MFDQTSTDSSRDSDNNTDKAQRKRRKQGQSRVQMAKKRQRDDVILPFIGIPTTCSPNKYPSYNVATHTVSSMYLRYIQNLQQNDCVARPENWAGILNHSTYQKRLKASGVKQAVLKSTILQHPWNNLHSIHYIPIDTATGFQQQLRNGLPLPVLILPDSKLGREIASQSVWSSQPLQVLLDEILKPDHGPINIQDHGLDSISTFTIEKTCKDVRDRFKLEYNRRGPAWNCLEVKDNLVGFKGPKALEHGGSLCQWQTKDLFSIDKNRTETSALSGGKKVDEWLLVSEQTSRSTAYVDVGFATWISCLAGKKTFWLRNPSVRDHRIWKTSNVDDDHRRFQEPWARVDLYPRSVL